MWESGSMKKNSDIFVLSFLLIILLLVVSAFLLNDFLEETDTQNKTYPLTIYKISESGYELDDVKDSSKEIYFLYHSSGSYILKRINKETGKEKNTSVNTTSTCSLKSESKNIYIACKEENSLSIYNEEFVLQKESSITSKYDYALNRKDGYSIYQSINVSYPVVLSARCTSNCYLIRQNDLTGNIALYKESSLLEDNIKSYQEYEEGFLTHDTKNLNVYNVNNFELKAFSIANLDISGKNIALGNSFNIYVANDKVIDVYNLYSQNKNNSINIKAVEGKLQSMSVYGNYLSLVAGDKLYIYDVTALEQDNNENKNYYENDLVKDKVDKYYNEYKVKINIEDDPSTLNSKYKITKVTSYSDLANALSYLEDYFTIFNKTFFSRFGENGSDGLEIYFAKNIYGITSGYNNTNVVGLSFQKNNKYILVISTSSDENVLNILAHETMHAIDNYLSVRNVNFKYWNNFNPPGFNYSSIYYINEVYSDTLNNNKDYDSIYFIDNYARSSALEDRARIFEYICRGENFEQYPNLNGKVTYLKKVLIQNFPELQNISIFVP